MSSGPVADWAPEGAGQRAVVARHGSLIRDLGLLTAQVRPCYRSASAFAFVYDPGAGRDGTDASAVALQLDALVRAMTEQPFALPPVGSPAATGPPVMGRPGVAAAAGPQTGVATAAEPTGAGATREKLVLAAQALANGWHREAEQLFLAAAAITPTDPLSWFGAGLAGMAASRSRAAEHLARSSRYLLATDPAGAVYAAILAAGLHEQSGDRPMARQILRHTLAQLSVPCPALSVHLARLGPDRRWRVEEALAADPLLEADLVALSLAPGAETVIERSRGIQAEVARLDTVIGQLRQVDGGPPWPDPPPSPVPGGGGERLALTALELALAAKVATCHEELARAGRVVEEREGARRDREALWRLRAGEAGRDLVHPVVVPVFWACAALAAVLVILALAGNLVAVAVPSLRVVVTVLLWALAAAVTAAAGWLVARVWWPRRRFPEARAAKVALPQLRFEAGQLRDEEFTVRRRYRQARADAERELQRIADRRQFLAPHRPGTATPSSTAPPPAPAAPPPLGGADPAHTPPAGRPAG